MKDAEAKYAIGFKELFFSLISPIKNAMYLNYHN